MTFARGRRHLPRRPPLASSHLHPHPRRTPGHRMLHSPPPCRLLTSGAPRCWAVRQHCPCWFGSVLAPRMDPVAASVLWLPLVHPPPTLGEDMDVVGTG